MSTTRPSGEAAMRRKRTSCLVSHSLAVMSRAWPCGARSCDESGMTMWCQELAVG